MFGKLRKAEELRKRRKGLKAKLEGSTANKPMSNSGKSSFAYATSDSNLKIGVNISLVIDRVQSFPSLACVRTLLELPLRQLAKKVSTTETTNTILSFAWRRCCRVTKEMKIITRSIGIVCD